MAGAGPPPGTRVTYSRQYRRCTKQGCPSCAAGGPGHGPYWYAYWRQDGRRCSRYLGKRPPPGMGTPTAQAMATPREAPAAAALRVRTLGGFAIWRGERAIPLEGAGRGALHLLQCLLGAPGHRLHREQLVEVLWPEADPSAGPARLRHALHALRRLLGGPGAGHLRWEGELLALQPLPGGEAPADWLDAAAFARAAHLALAGRDPDGCRVALALYGGTYLPEEPYAEWAAAMREGLARRHLALLLHLAALCRDGDQPAEAEHRLREALAADPCHEGAAQALMELLASGGQRGEALRVYQGVAAALDRELGLGPQAALEELRARLLAEAPVPSVDQAPGPRRPGRTDNLPAPLSSFVGRAWELGELRALLGETRLLTLTGAGGVGKSRLALELARGLLDRYPEGIWQVELAAIADPSLVPGAVAGALGVAEQAGRSLPATLAASLASRRLLLLLDNCEHLVGACAELAAALLGACPGLRVLATSRQALGLEGEVAWLVPALAYPGPEAAQSPARLAGYEAVQLFVARARAHRPAFVLTEANAGAVAQVCARLDGIPLALELAAGRLGALSVAEVAARLDDRFALLTGGSRAARPRQRTLRATMDWSWELLGEVERALLRRLAAFAGGWTLEVATAVLGGEAGTAAGAPQTLLDVLAGLVARSLVQVGEREGQSRYGLLETVRQYGQERLAEAGELALVRDRHLAYFLALAEEAVPRLTGPEQGPWLARLEAEHDNLRAALAWAGERGAGEERLRLAGALWRFWYMRGHLSEGRGWLAAALAGAQGSPATRAAALVGSGALALQQGDYGRAAALQEEALALRRTLGDQQGTAVALNSLGNVAYRQGDYPRAAALYEESLALKRALGDRRGVAATLDNLGNVAYRQGDYGRAAALHGEALALRRALGDTWGIAAALSNLGNVAYQQGDYGRALALNEESLALSRQMGARDLVAWGLESLAWVLGATGQARRAARLGGAAQALRETLGVPLWPEERAGHDQAMAAMRASLGAEGFAAAWASGAALSEERAVAEALGGPAGA